MPIYMDRHDLPGVTASHVLEAHQQDLKIQDEYDCKGLTYWFDEERQTAFCLIEAPNIKSVKSMHENAHGLIPHKIIEVDSSIVESFLGRIKDPQTQLSNEPVAVNEPAFRVIMASKLTFSNEAYENWTTENTKTCRDNHNAIVRSLIGQFEGRVAGHIEKTILCSFLTVSQALDCALEIRKAFHKATNGMDKRMLIQFGISAGSPIADSNEFFGQAINKAKSLCYLANKEQILLSSSIGEQYRKDGLTTIKGHTDIQVMNHNDECFIDDLLQIMDKSWQLDNFNLNDLAQQIGVSKSKLYRQLTLISGKSPNEFINEFRLLKTIALIDKQEKSIAEIAYESGFSSPSYYSKCFKKRFGILPSAYVRI